MKHIKSIFAGVLAMTLAWSGCSSDWLETSPTDGIPESALNTAEDLYVALNGIHRKMVSSDRGRQGQGGEPGFIICREVAGDDMTWPSSYTGWHTGSLNWSIHTAPANANNYTVWHTYYEFILNCNKILEKWEEMSDLEKSLALANYVKGEAKGLRAWAHFQLVQVYAFRYDASGSNSHYGVPIKTSSAVEQLPRNTVAEVYEFINSELLEAAELLDGYKANDINHYSSKVIYGLLARVALTQQNYKAAGDYAAKSIELAEAEGHRIMTMEQTSPELNPTAFSEISTTTKDAIYAALTQDDQISGPYSFYSYMSWNYGSSASRTGIKCISQSTYDLMSETDVRRAWWQPEGIEAGPDKHEPEKYQNRKFTARSGSQSAGDFAFMRLTEIYLMATEAYARAGDTPKAKTYFAKFIAERDPEYTDLGYTGAAFAEEVMNHRRIELWGEGFRWFDLKRLNLPCHRTGNNFDESFCGFLKKEVTDLGWAYEIPQIETNYNEWYLESGRMNYQ